VATLLMRRPLATGVERELAWTVIVTLGAVVIVTLVPAMPGYSTTELSQSLIVILLDVVLLIGLVAALAWWRRCRLRRAEPVAEPTRVVAASTAAGLAARRRGKGANRGRAHDAPGRVHGGVWRAVLLSSLFFGLSYLGNSLLRGVSWVILAEAVGAAPAALAGPRSGCGALPSGCRSSGAADRA
jgi:hypothetical protein